MSSSSRISALTARMRDASSSPGVERYGSKGRGATDVAAGRGMSRPEGWSVLSIDPHARGPDCGARGGPIHLAHVPIIRARPRHGKSESFRTGGVVPCDEGVKIKE